MIVSDRNSKLGQRGGENVGFLVLEEIKNNSPLLGWRFRSRTRKKQNAPCESRRFVLCTIFSVVLIYCWQSSQDRESTPARPTQCGPRCEA